MKNAVLRRAFAAAAVAAVFGTVRTSFAEDEAGPKESEVKAQMRKIVELMRENEKALLDASRGDAAAPKRVDVAPPAAPQDEVTKGDSAGKGAAKKMDDLVGGAAKRGDQVRREIETLIRMIPH